MSAPVPPPAWRRRKDARPAEIIDAGIAEFSERGYAGTTLASVARRAGVSKGTIYHYFDDKDALFRAAFRSRFVDALGDPDRPLPLPQAANGSVASWLETAIRTAYRGLAASDALGLLRVILVEHARFPDLVRRCRDDLERRVTAPLQRLIDLGIERGELADGPYRDVPAVLFGPGIALALLGALVEGDGDVVFEALLTTLMRGVLARPDTT